MTEIRKDASCERIFLVIKSLTYSYFSNFFNKRFKEKGKDERGEKKRENNHELSLFI